MPIPATVDAFLRKRPIAFHLLDFPPSTASGPTPVVRATLLKQGEERLQVLSSTNSLLDLERVTARFGGQWRALCPETCHRLITQRGLTDLPGLPVFDMPTLVDSILLEQPELLLATGDDSYIRMSAEDFRQLTDGAVVAPVSAPLATLEKASCDQAEDTADITRAVASFTQLRVRQRLEETLELPPLPETAQRIIKLRVDPYADIKDLSDIVESDPSLAAQVVSWAASPYYAAPGRIKSVHDAIVRVLGFDLVLNLALGLSLGRTLQLPREAPRGFTPYWQQAVYAATGVEALVGTIPPKDRPTIGLAYLGGLLHNFGYLLLAEVFPPHFERYCRMQEANPRVPHGHIERHLLGVTREQMAAWLMRLWNMPDTVSIALRHQNNPDYDGPDAPYALLIHATLRLLRERGIGNAPLEPVPAQVWQRLGIEPERAAAAIDHVVQAGNELRHIAAGMAA